MSHHRRLGARWGAGALGLLALASGCTVAEREGPSAGPSPSPAASSPSSRGEPRVVGFAGYLRPRLGFEADELVALDGDTFDPTGESLRLGDSVTTPVVDPDKSLLALGGYNFGKVIVVDPVTFEVRTRVEVARVTGVGSPEVHVVGWPAPDRLLGYAQPSAAHSLLPGLMEKRLPATTYPATGSAGARESFGREAASAGSSRVLVSGRETHVVRGGRHLSVFERAPQIVDVDSWRVRRTFEEVGDARLARGLLLGRASNGDLVALRRNGDVAYRRPGARRSWIVVGDRLLETEANGYAVELDIRTGRVLSDLGDLGGSLPNAFIWPPKTSRVERVTL